MVGVELVKEPATKEPAPEIAAMIAENAKNNNLIVGRGGALGNVLSHGIDHVVVKGP
jgi:4-aminobutyrate aminotransferase-like enzyme